VKVVLHRLPWAYQALRVVSVSGGEIVSAVLSLCSQVLWNRTKPVM